MGPARARVGFERKVGNDALGMQASNAVALFPFAEHVKTIRHYQEFRT